MPYRTEASYGTRSAVRMNTVLSVGCRYFDSTARQGPAVPSHTYPSILQLDLSTTSEREYRQWGYIEWCHRHTDTQRGCLLKLS